MSKIACVAVVKNEQRHIAEWIEYQFVIGFDTVVLLDNRSTDGTIDTALQFAGSRDIRIFDWNHVSQDYQILAYQNAIQRFGDKFDWMAFFDTDEFLVLDPGLNLKERLAARVDAAAIAVSWAIFGSSGHREMPEGRVIENFTRRSLPSFGPNLHVKSIVRPKTVRACLNAHMFEVDGAYTDLAGRPIAWRQPGLLDREPDYACGKLHHYFTRSLAHWTEKLARGYPDTKRKFEDFADYDRNEIFDDSAVRFFQSGAQINSEADEARNFDTSLEMVAPLNSVRKVQIEFGPRARLGIAITTFNRSTMLLTQIETLQKLTSRDFELVVCDDGSSDDTIEQLASRQIRVVGGVNRGIAWNKNRGLFYLREIAGCDVILLLDDDTLPTCYGWEIDWLAAAQKFGHINFRPAGTPVISGSHVPADPAISDGLWGQCIAFSRYALSYVGYMDTRFKGYGHEHTDLTKRAIRAGFGGFLTTDPQPRRCFYSIESGMSVIPSHSNIDTESIAKNGQLLELSENEPIYRNAWRNEQEYRALRQEIDRAVGATPCTLPVPISAPNDEELFSGFISLGDNCEFGLVQRAAGVEPLDLLRFGGTGEDETGIIMALRERFSGFSDPNEFNISDHGGEWIVTNRRYDITFHSNQRPAQVSLATVTNDETKRLGFLARKLIDDLENSSRIFVRKTNKPVADTTMHEMYDALKGYGRPVLLWVTMVQDEHQNPGIQQLAPGLLRGYIRRLAPYSNAHDIRLHDWRVLCRAARNVLGDVQPVKNQ